MVSTFSRAKICLDGSDRHFDELIEDALILVVDECESACDNVKAENK